MRGPVLLLLSCVACQNRPSSPASDAATAFDDLLAYVPDGLESLLLVDVTRPDVPGALTSVLARDDQRLQWGFTHTFTPIRRLVVSAGSFRMRGLGWGDYEGVTVWELAEDPEDEREWLADAECFQRVELDGRIAYAMRKPTLDMTGHESWGPEEVWRAFVAPRILVEASRRRLMEAALRGGHPGGRARAETRGFDATVDWRAPLVLLRNYEARRTANTLSQIEDPYAPARVPIDAAHLSVLTGEPLRWRIEVRAASPADARTTIARQLGIEPPVPADLDAVVDPDVAAHGRFNILRLHGLVGFNQGI